MLCFGFEAQEEYEKSRASQIKVLVVSLSTSSVRPTFCLRAINHRKMIYCCDPRKQRNGGAFAFATFSLNDVPRRRYSVESNIRFRISNNLTDSKLSELINIFNLLAVTLKTVQIVICGQRIS